MRENIILGFAISDAWSRLVEKMSDWLDQAVLMLPNLILAIIVMVLALFISRYVKRLLMRILKKFSDNIAVNKLISIVATIVIIILALFLALNILKLQQTVTSLLAGAGIAGLIVGLAFQKPIINTMSGVIIATRKTYGLGHLVKSNDYFGHVEEISIRDTIIRTLSGQRVVLPNELIVENPLENYSLSAERRIDVHCGVEYRTDLELTQKLVKEAIESLEDVDVERGIECYFTEFSNSSINFVAFYWLRRTEQADYLRSRSNAIKAIKAIFDENDITIPFPIRTLELGHSATKLVDNAEKALENGKGT